jgi:hypothetical protein
VQQSLVENHQEFPCGESVAKETHGIEILYGLRVAGKVEIPYVLGGQRVESLPSCCLDIFEIVRLHGGQRLVRGRSGRLFPAAVAVENHGRHFVLDQGKDITG